MPSTKEYMKEYNKKRAQKQSEYNKEYYKENRDEIVKDRHEKRPIYIIAERLRYALFPEKRKVKDQNRRAMELRAGKITAQEWRDVLEKYDYKCLCCGTDKNITMDHVIPLKLGGTNTKDNVQPLCKTCNFKKHIKIIDYRG
jgi:5-methylcytosine-specific restriction endonuclease McrA